LAVKDQIGLVVAEDQIGLWVIKDQIDLWAVNDQIDPNITKPPSLWFERLKRL